MVITAVYGGIPCGGEVTRGMHAACRGAAYLVLPCRIAWAVSSGSMGAGKGGQYIRGLNGLMAPLGDPGGARACTGRQEGRQFSSVQHCGGGGGLTPSSSPLSRSRTVAHASFRSGMEASTSAVRVYGPSTAQQHIYEHSTA